MPNICERIVDNPDEVLGNCTREQLVEAAILIIGRMSTDDLDLFAEWLGEDETAFDGLLSALERNQPS